MKIIKRTIMKKDNKQKNKITTYIAIGAFVLSILSNIFSGLALNLSFKKFNFEKTQYCTNLKAETKEKLRSLLFEIEKTNDYFNNICNDLTDSTQKENVEKRLLNLKECEALAKICYQKIDTATIESLDEIEMAKVSILQDIEYIKERLQHIKENYNKESNTIKNLNNSTNNNTSSNKTTNKNVPNDNE